MTVLQRFTARLDRFWPTASLRSYLFATMLLATLPAAALICVLRLGEIHRQGEQIDGELARSAAALAQAVDRELQSSIDGLDVLAQSELFQQGRVAALGRLLQRRPRPDWDSIFLLDRDGSVVLDTAAHRADARELAAMRDLQRAVLSGRIAVSGRWERRSPGSQTVAVAVPIRQNGRPRYVLGARMGEQVWDELSSGVARPRGASAALFDAGGALIGSSAAPLTTGARLPADSAALMQDRPSGVDRASAIDGSDVYAAWDTVARAGWHVQVALPAAPIDAAHRSAMAGTLAASGASVLLGLLLAWLVARRVSRPLRQLASSGPESLPPRVSVREIALLRDALRIARDSAADGALPTNAPELDARRQVQLVEDAAHVGFFRYQFGTDRLAWTPGQCKLFGVGELANGTLRDWFDRAVPQDRDRIERELWTACALRREQETIEYRVPAKDGVRWLSSSVLLQYDGDGRPAQLVGVSVDVSDRVEAERGRTQLAERAIAARQEAEAASRAKDEFLTMLGHELRNPLGAISAAIEVLASAEEGSDTAAEARRIVARQTRNLAHMMNDLLDVGRVVAGKIVLAREPVNLAAIARRVDETLAITGEAGLHRLEFALADAWVDGDAVRLEQVVGKLLMNAIKYTPAGRPIQVRVGVLDGQAVLEVQDAGLGIPAALLPRMFDLFVQGERPLDRRAGGLGIGLTLVRRLVQLHGGSVDVETSEHGSRFTVRLPAIDAPPAGDDDTLPPSRRRKVLVVEDNADVMAALRAKLELDGHTVTTARDGVEGLNRLLKLKPEVSIVDIGLPGLTGFELARHARAAGYAGRMIAMSGYGAERDAREALVAGFDAYLVKPVDPHQLRASLGAD